MDGNRFDSLTKAFASGTSRRTLIKSALGLASAASIRSVSTHEVAARRSRFVRTTTTSAPTTTPPPPVCHDYQCGYDCCASEFQCCDGECCPSGSICLTQVFQESAIVQEETCCPEVMACDSRCCLGTCFDPDASTNPEPASIAEQFILTCCPAGRDLCPGSNGTFCCQGDTPDCCLRDGVAHCINRDTECCTNLDCGEDLFCNPSTGLCGEKCVPPLTPGQEPTQNYFCDRESDIDECCDGSFCCNGFCYPNGSCCGKPDNQLCQPCENCEFALCVPDPEQNGDQCGENQICCDGVCCDIGQVCRQEDALQAASSFCCTPRTCDDLGQIGDQCGSGIPDRCGLFIDCACDEGSICDPGTNRCVATCDPPCDICNDCKNSQCEPDDNQNGVACGVDQVCCIGTCCDKGQICIPGRDAIQANLVPGPGCCAPLTCDSPGQIDEPCGVDLDDTCGGAVTCLCAEGLTCDFTTNTCVTNTCVLKADCESVPGCSALPPGGGDPVLICTCEDSVCVPLCQVNDFPCGDSTNCCSQCCDEGFCAPTGACLKSCTESSECDGGEVCCFGFCVAGECCPGEQCGDCSTCTSNFTCALDCSSEQTCCGTGGSARCCTKEACIDGSCCDRQGQTPCGTNCCEGFNEKCCPATDFCIPFGTTCCIEDDECTYFNLCEGVPNVWLRRYCGNQGFCVTDNQNCDTLDPCTIDGCNDETGCIHTSKVCDAPPNSCFVETGTCNPSSGECEYAGIVCDTPPGPCYVKPGTCNSATGSCEYPFADAGTACDTCITCDGAGSCNVPLTDEDPKNQCGGSQSCCDGVCTVIGTQLNCGFCGDVCSGDGAFCIVGKCGN